ncbi:hypothetical protein DL771_007995 [Monosporascus sp. 5C6A]|nr:hypothetical protein DL771_007995 [Monosporascus sp. 5C6A]
MLTTLLTTLPTSASQTPPDWPEPEPEPEPASLPRIPEEVTASWFSSILGHKVNAIEPTKAIRTTASNLFFTIRIYQRESDFFSKSRLSMNLPKVWWADHGVVVTDDLDCKGCEFTDPLQTWPVERVQVAVEQLTALHGGTWGMKQEDYPWITLDYGQFHTGPHANLRREDRRGRRTPSLRLPERLEAGSRGPREVLQERVTRLRRLPIVCIGSAFHDLAYFEDGTLSLEDRRAHENDVIGHYLKALAGFGGPTIERDDEVMAEYAHSFMSSFSWVVAPYSMQSKERVHAMTKRYMAAVDDHKTTQLLEALPEIVTPPQRPEVVRRNSPRPAVSLLYEAAPSGLLRDQSSCASSLGVTLVGGRTTATRAIRIAETLASDELLAVPGANGRVLAAGSTNGPIRTRAGSSSLRERRATAVRSIYTGTRRNTDVAVGGAACIGVATVAVSRAETLAADELPALPVAHVLLLGRVSNWANGAGTAKRGAGDLTSVGRRGLY